MDLFVVPSVTFELLYAFVIIKLGPPAVCRRQGNAPTES
jgi:hypothetical protein